MMKCPFRTGGAAIVMGFGQQDMDHLGIRISNSQFFKLLPVCISQIVKTTNDLIEFLLSQIKPD